MTLEDLVAAGDLSDPIQLLADTDFRWGDVQAIRYDPNKTDIFPEPFIAHLYQRTRASGRSKLGSLPLLFCGMTNLSIDAICAYLTQRPICVVGEWRKWNFTCPPPVREVGEPYFHDLGFCFPSVNPTVTQASNVYNPQNSCFAGYTLFQDAWKTPQQTICMYLGLAWLFHTFQLIAIHGQRYSDNLLTKRFTHRFGFKDVGTIPYTLLKAIDQPLVSMTASTLLRSDFIALTREVLSNARQMPSI